VRDHDVNVAAWIGELCDEEKLPAAYGESVHRYVGRLAARIAALHRDRARPVVVGICGAQGSGKSTLALFLENWLRRECGLAATSLSLDDLYLSKRQRLELAHRHHPLLQTRGVPGTHDVSLALDILARLTSVAASVAVPVFDKASDDRLSKSRWRRVAAPVDVILFEGWCVGARPQPDDELRLPVNALEAEEDEDGAWRRYVNERLRDEYATLFGRLDTLLLLRVPSFAKVVEWRGLQEEKLRGFCDWHDIECFTRYFERLTRHVLSSMPHYANALIDIDDEHRMASLEFPGWPGA